MRAAFVFLTRLPLGGFPYRAEDWRWSAAYFPLVGAAIGALLGLMGSSLTFVGDWASATTVVVAGVLLTGALHEDALADTADALGGGRDAAGIFRILKDSRLGTYGTVAVVSSLLWRVAFVAEAENVLGILIAVHCLARTVPVWLMATLSYVTPPDLAKSRSVSRAGLGPATVATVAATAIVATLVAVQAIRYEQFGAMLVASILVAGAAGRWFFAKVGGVTGDLLGAAEQITECAALAAAVVACRL